MKTEYLATIIFFIALVHTFLVSYFSKLAHKFEKGTAAEAFFHLLSDVEVVFGFWAFIFLAIWSLKDGVLVAIEYQQSLNLTEPLFIFCIMIVSSTRPVISITRQAILVISNKISKITRLKLIYVQFFTLLTLGPILGSAITEPAAITITALLLYRMINENKIESSLLYGCIGLLFVNISVGGALTNFAAPPILIVARTWGWSLADVFLNLGEAALVAVFVNTLTFILLFKNKIIKQMSVIETDYYPMPKWVVGSHLIFLLGIVLSAHYTQVFFGLFLIFIGLVSVTKNYQDQLKFREGLMVSFFLSGLIVFGPFQRWWLEPLILSFNNQELYLGATLLTTITDNAALTYLGSQVSSLTDLGKWALVAGSLVGGGMTIVANAPNPAGFSILSSKFPDGTLNAVKLIKAAFLPTLIALICFYLKVFVSL